MQLQVIFWKWLRSPKSDRPSLMSVCVHVGMKLFVCVGDVFYEKCVCVGMGGGGCWGGGWRFLIYRPQAALRLLSAATILYLHILLSSRERKTLLATRFPLSPYSLSLFLPSVSLPPHICQYYSSSTGNQLDHCVFLAKRGRHRQDNKKERRENDIGAGGMADARPLSPRFQCVFVERRNGPGQNTCLVGLFQFHSSFCEHSRLLFTFC